MSYDGDIESIECRHVVFCKSTDNENDLHLVKEQIHYSSGKIVPNVRLIKNFKRPFWIVKKGQRNFEQKKEWIEEDRCIKYESTQIKLSENICKAIEAPWITGGLRKIFRNPYIYGADISSNAVIKKAYQNKYPNVSTMYSVAVFDIETDMVNGTDEIIMATLSYRDKVITAIKGSFLKGHSDTFNRLQKLLKKYIGEYVEKRNIKWDLVVVDSESTVVKTCMEEAHKWKPDVIAIWNIDFDIPRVILALEKAGIDPKDVFSDPSIPEEYRHFSYNKGMAIKVTASGKEMSRNNYEQWHTVNCPSSFYFIDAMCLYYQIRSQGGKEQSYSLNNILDKHLGIRKLNFTEAEKYVKAEWHQYMQTNHPLEYVIYNVFDCVSMEILDENTSDIAVTMPMFSGCSSFSNFNSQPKRLADTMHYFCLEYEIDGKKKPYVYGTTSDEMITADDNLITSGNGWISNLQANLVADNGLCVLEEDLNLRSNIRNYVADLDVSSSYPSGGVVFNISRGTTHKELIKIEGVSEMSRRMAGINLSGGATNAVEIACDAFHLPSMEALLKEFQSSNI